MQHSSQKNPFTLQKWTVAAALVLTVGCGAPSFRIRQNIQPTLTPDLSLPSGLRVLVQEDHTQPMISAVMIVGSGSTADPVQKEGTAHLLEHLWFRSRHETLPPVEEALLQLGAAANATTSPDTTTFVTVAPKNALRAVMRLEALRLEQPLQGIEASELAAEREVVRQELRERVDNSEGHGLTFLFNKLFPASHPYHRLEGTTHDSLDSIDLEVLKAYAKAHYQPANVTLMISGDVSVPEVAEALGATFPPSLLEDPATPGAPIRRIELKPRLTGPAPEPPPPFHPELTTVKGRVDRPTILMAWALPGAFRDQDAVMRLATQVLASKVRDGVNKDMSQLVNAYAQFNQASCWLEPRIEASAAVCKIVLGDTQNPAHVLEAAVDGARGLFGPQGGDRKRDYFNKLRWRAISLLQAQAEDLFAMNGRATQTATWTHFTGDASYLSRLEQQLVKVTDYSINAFGYRYFARDRVAAVLVEPLEPGLHADDASSQARAVAARGGAITVSEALATITPEQIEELVVQPDLTRLKTFTLENGMKVVLMPHGNRGMARTTLIFRGGEAQEAEPGGFSMARALQSPPATMRSQLLSIGAEMWDIAEPLEQRFVIKASADNLAEQLYILKDRLVLSRVDTSDRAGLAHAFEAQLKYKQAQLGAEEEHAWLSRLLPGTWLARRTEPSDMLAHQLTPGLVMEGWLRQVFQPANATLFVVGQVDVVEAERLVRKYFGRWRPILADGKSMPIPAPPPSPPARQILLLDEPLATITQLQLHCQVAPFTLQNYEGLQVLATLGDFALRQRLRTELAAAYATDASLQLEPGGISLLHLRTTVPNAQAIAALSTFFELTERLQSQAQPPEVLNLAKATLARQYGLGQHSLARMSARLIEPVRLSLDWDLIRLHALRLSQVTSDALMPLMDRCANHEVVTLIGPAQTLAEALRQQGIAFELVKRAPPPPTNLYSP